MLNHIDVMGRITYPLELRKTPSDVSTITFTIACDDDYTPKDGEKDTDFIRVKAWRNTADFIAKFFDKGRMIAVSGRLKADNYTDKEGNKRTDTYILADRAYFADSKKSEGQSTAASTAFSEEVEANESELPF